MIREGLRSICSILKESPFFTELSTNERDTMVEDLLKSYPQLTEESVFDDEVGYEASWFMSQDH